MQDHPDEVKATGFGRAKLVERAKEVVLVDLGILPLGRGRRGRQGKPGFFAIVHDLMEEKVCFGYLLPGAREKKV